MTGTLGPLLVLTDASRRPDRPLVATVAAAVEGGARVVVLREKHLPASERAALAEQLLPLLHDAGGVLIVASDPGLGAGVHLAAADPAPAGDQRPAWVGRSCHRPSEVATAAAEGCDYATLSPIFPTASKPGYGPPLGPAALGDLPLPTYALGGVDAATVAACRRAGASGVAVMGAVMAAPDPADTVRRLLAAWREAAPSTHVHEEQP